MRYLPLTQPDREAMLAVIGAATIDDLFVDVPEAGKTLSKGDEAAVVESVKAASDVYSPVSGTVTEGNAALADDSSLVNSDAEAAGWFFKLTLSDPSELEGLMDEAAYREWLTTL